MGIARRNPLCMSINSADKVFGHAPRERGDSPHQHEEMDNYFPCTGETHRLMRRRTKGLLFAFWLCVNDGECFLSASFAACWATPGSFQGSVCLHMPWLELRTGHAAACGHPASSTGAALGAQAFPHGEKCAPTPIPQGSAGHIQAIAYSTPPYPVDSTSSQPKTSQQRSSSASITDNPAGIARNTGLAGIRPCSHTSQASDHSSSPLGCVGQSLWTEMLTSLAAYQPAYRLTKDIWGRTPSTTTNRPPALPRRLDACLEVSPATPAALRDAGRPPPRFTGALAPWLALHAAASGKFAAGRQSVPSALWKAGRTNCGKELHRLTMGCVRSMVSPGCFNVCQCQVMPKEV